MAPKAEKKPAEKKPEEEKAKKSVETYKINISKVLKQVHPDITISPEAIAVMNPFINDIYEKLTHEVAKLTNENPNMTSSEIQAFVPLILLDLLAKHGGSKGTKAVTTSTSY